MAESVTGHPRWLNADGDCGLTIGARLRRTFVCAATARERGVPVVPPSRGWPVRTVF